MQTLTITRIASDGDGAATDADGKVRYLPFTLPGETIRLSDPPEVTAASPDRVTPPCQHFGTCGGCTLQHWADAPYAAWKTALLTDALRRAGYPDAPIAPMVHTPAGARRRIDFAIRRHGATLTLGLHARASDTVIDIAECPILHPALAALLPPLRTLLRSLAALKREGSVVLNLLDTGPDLLLRTDDNPTTGDRTRLAAFATAHGTPRIAIAPGRRLPEIAAQSERPVLTFAGIKVTPPPGAFLQASIAGQDAITAAVLAGLPGKLTSKSRAAELYAGSGTLTFPLATQLRVDAFEGDAAASAALKGAVQAAAIGRITVATRDLVRQPLMRKELAPYACAVLDPPFAGAGPQMPELAASNIPRIIYISCNPTALTRDATMLHAAGYRLLSATPVDQFLWSARLESVCVFTNEKRSGAVR